MQSMVRIRCSYVSACCMRRYLYAAAVALCRTDESMSMRADRHVSHACSQHTHTGVMYFCPLIIQALLQGRAIALAPAPAPAPAPAVQATDPPHWFVALLSTLPYVLASITLVITSWSAARTGVCACVHVVKLHENRKMEEKKRKACLQWQHPPYHRYHTHHAHAGEVKWHVVGPQLLSAGAFMLLPLLMRASVVLAIIGLMLSTGTSSHLSALTSFHPSKPQ